MSVSLEWGDEGRALDIHACLRHIAQPVSPNHVTILIPALSSTLNSKREFYPIFQVVLVVKNLPSSTGDVRDTGSIPGLGISPGGRRVNPLWSSCLEIPMDRESWQVIVHSDAQSQT